jgi:type I restriction enzyme S subunit
MNMTGLVWENIIPKDWKVISVWHAYNLGRGRVLSQETIASSQGIYPVYSSQTENDGIFGYLDTYNFDGEYITWTTDGANAGTVFQRTGKFNCTNVCGTLKSKKTIPVDNQYVTYCLQISTAEFVRHDINPKLMNNVMSKIRFPLPPLSIQKAIATYLDKETVRIDALIAKKERQIELLEEKRQAIITHAITKGLDPKAKMKDSGVEWIGEIPEGWQVKKLRYLGTCQNGISKGGESFGSGFPFVSYSDAYKNIELPQTVEGLVESTDQERNAYSVQVGDILFTRTSETVEEIGYASTCMRTIPDAVFAGFLIRFRPANNVLYIGFSKYYFRANLLRRFFVKEMSIVTRASLSQDLLKNLPVLLPPKEEMKEIADYLDRINTQINDLQGKIDQSIKMLLEYRSSLITAAVSGQIDISSKPKKPLRGGGA